MLPRPKPKPRRRLKAPTFHAKDGLADLMFIENAGDFAARRADSADHGVDAAAYLPPLRGRA